LVAATLARVLGAIALLLAATRAYAAEGLDFRFELDNEYATSAGVFAADGTLVRTLWSNRRLAPGRHAERWDGLDDDGHAAREPRYEIRVLTHNVRYAWDGVIGNSSPEPTSPLHQEGPSFFADLVVSGDRAFFTVPTEGPVPTMRFFDVARPQSWQRRPGLPMAYGAILGLVAADAERVYWARNSSPWPHTWGKGGDRAFVVATDRGLGREERFAAGTAVCVQATSDGCYHDDEFDARVASAIDVVAEIPEDPRTPELESARNDATGIAVQRRGELLLVAHGRLRDGELHVLDKRTGELRARVPFPGIGRIAVGDAPQELWAITTAGDRSTLARFRLGPPPSYSPTRELTVAGLDRPLALALAPEGRLLVVADGGASQQVKGFDRVSGRLLWTLGLAGGYRENGPEVTNDKFAFARFEHQGTLGQRIESTFVSIGMDGSIWVGDPGVSRILHFDAARAFREQIAFVPVSYNIAVDRNDPTRLFSVHTEYQTDYAEAGPAGPHWRLQRYFGESLPLDNGYHGFGAGFGDVATLGNGRTYGLLRRAGGFEVVEVPAHGDLRRSGTVLRDHAYLERDGSLHRVREDASGQVVFSDRRLAGFDESGFPRWDAPVAVASVGRQARDPRVDPYRAWHSRYLAVLGDGTRALFDPANDPDHGAGPPLFHLAAVSPGARHWRWRASPAAGRFDLAAPDGTFDSSRPWYAGMSVTALGADLVYAYHGEGWHGNSQANQYLHWNGDGLFIGQFGTPVERGVAPAASGQAGNVLSLQLVRANGETYLWHSDESAHAGVHRWHFEGLEWIRELSGAGEPGQAITLDQSIDRSDRPRGRLAPAGLVAIDVGRQGLLDGPGSDPLLVWGEVDAGATGVEIERLNPTYVGPRFEAIARVAVGTRHYLDREPLAGEPTTYRVRALYPGGASRYSNHVHFTARARRLVLEAQDFESPPPEMRTDFPTGHVSRAAFDIVADPARPGHHVLHIRAEAGDELAGAQTRHRWDGSRGLFAALERSVGRARGSRPDLYEVSFRLRPLATDLRDGEVAVQVDPGYDLFSSSGRREDLSRESAWRQEPGRASFHDVTFRFAAIPNGLAQDALGQFRGLAPHRVVIVFPVTLRSRGAKVEFLVSDVKVARLDPADNSLPRADDDDRPVAIRDAALGAALRNVLGVRAGEVITRRQLSVVAWLDLQGRGVIDLTGLEWARNLRAVDLRGNPGARGPAVDALRTRAEVALVD
jgi:hypothetical protein